LGIGCLRQAVGFFCGKRESTFSEIILEITCFVKNNLLTLHQNILKKMKKIKLCFSYILFLITLSCSNNEMNNLDHKDKEAILGKWELVSYGMYEDGMIEPYDNDGSYVEYLRDGRTKTVSMGYLLPLNYYSFKDNYLIVKPVDGVGTPNYYKYKFNDNNKTLHLTRHPLFQPAGEGGNGSYVFITNFEIYKKIEL
jgi:hypothetical protein